MINPNMEGETPALPLTLHVGVNLFEKQGSVAWGDRFLLTKKISCAIFKLIVRSPVLA